ncbi:MAG: sugar ABC transporter permease [Defluviitaleaceae bacterium]|nr:sugar ABC transporter permease [Defluviitaleaceae bacterium]
MVKMKKPKGRFRLSMANKNAISGYLFTAPFIIGFLAFMAYPLVQSIRFVFSNVTADPANNRFTSEFIGIANIRHVLLVEPSFVQYMTEDLVFMATMVLPIIIFSFFIAVLLNNKFVGRGFVRAVFFLPVILASGVLVNLETNNSLLDLVSQQIQEQNAMRASVTGVLENILASATGAAAMGGLGDLINFVFDTINQLYTIAMASGIQILIFLAGLQAISPSIFEASSIEGATSWENFWKITFPMLSPMILVVVVYTVVDFMVRTDSNAMQHVDITMMRRLDYGQGSAMAWIYLLIIAAVLGILSFIISRMVYYYD